MPREFNWVDGPWTGRLALAARPRGGDWLSQELEGWQRRGVHAISSLLTPSEEQDLELSREESEARALGINFLPFPIADRQVPQSEGKLTRYLERLDQELSAGKNLLMHCRQGIGRAGLVAACLLVSKGVSPSAAIEMLSAARGTAVPETDEQFRWIEHYAENFMAAK